MSEDENLLVKSRSIRHEYIYYVLPKIIPEDHEHAQAALSIGLDSNSKGRMSRGDSISGPKLKRDSITQSQRQSIRQSQRSRKSFDIAKQASERHNRSVNAGNDFTKLISNQQHIIEENPMFKQLSGVKDNNLEGATPGATPMGPVGEAPRQSEQDNGEESQSSASDVGAEKEEVNLSDGDNDDNQVDKQAFQETGAFLSNPLNWTAPDKPNKKQNDE